MQESPAILVDNNANNNSNQNITNTNSPNTSLQIRALTSPVLQNVTPAALPPRYLPSSTYKEQLNQNLKNNQFLKFNNNSINNNRRVSGTTQSSNWHRGFVSMMMANNNNENEADIKLDDYELESSSRLTRNISQHNAVS